MISSTYLIEVLDKRKNWMSLAKWKLDLTSVGTRAVNRVVDSSLNPPGYSQTGTTVQQVFHLLFGNLFVLLIFISFYCFFVQKVILRYGTNFIPNI